MIRKKLTNTTNKLGRVWTFGLWTCLVLWMRGSRFTSLLLFQLFCGCGFPLHCFSVYLEFGIAESLESNAALVVKLLWISFVAQWFSPWLGAVCPIPLRSFFCNVLPVLQRSSVQKALDAFSMCCMWANFGKRWRMQALQCDAGGRPAEAYGVHWMAYVVYRRTSLSIQLQCPCEACSCHASRRQATASWWVPQQCWDSAPMRRENHRAALHDFGPGVLPGVT